MTVVRGVYVGHRQRCICSITTIVAHCMHASRSKHARFQGLLISAVQHALPLP